MPESIANAIVGSAFREAFLCNGKSLDGSIKA